MLFHACKDQRDYYILFIDDYYKTKIQVELNLYLNIVYKVLYLFNI